MSPGVESPRAVPVSVLGMGVGEKDQLDVVTPWAEGWRSALRQLRVELERSIVELSVIEEQVNSEQLDGSLGPPSEFVAVIDELITAAARRLDTRLSRARVESELRIERAREEAKQLVMAVCREEPRGSAKSTTLGVADDRFAKLVVSDDDVSIPPEVAPSPQPEVVPAPAEDDGLTPAAERTLDLAFEQYWRANGSDELLRSREMFWGDLYQLQGLTPSRRFSGSAQ